MTQWISPNPNALKEVVSTASGHLLLCSPYINSGALDIVTDVLPKAVTSVEVWTKLSHRDWLTGASDPEALLDFCDYVDTQKRAIPVSLRSGELLHAKIIISDGPMAMAGSANLTRGGYFRNLEAARIVEGDEIGELRSVVSTIRPDLSRVELQAFREFVSRCQAQAGTQEALIDLILQEVPDAVGGDGKELIPFGAFRQFLDESPRGLARDILRIANNDDGNNNTGKVKQAFFAVQRFLQEYPQHHSFVASLRDDEWFSVQESHLWGDWQQFLSDFHEEYNEAHQYRIATLMRYLTPSSGGTRMGGGGGDNELKRVWPYVGRVMSR